MKICHGKLDAEIYDVLILSGPYNMQGLSGFVAH